MDLEITKRKVFSLKNYLKLKWSCLDIIKAICSLAINERHLRLDPQYLGVGKKVHFFRESDSSMFALLLNSCLNVHVDMNLTVFHYAVSNTTFSGVEFCCRNF